MQKFLLFALLLSFFSSTQHLAAGEALFNITRLPVEIGGTSYKLESLLVRPDGPGPFPLALLTHGAAGSETYPETMDIYANIGNWAQEFANRGYMAVAVMRRGYGFSDGEVADDAGTCNAPNPQRYIDAHSDDIVAALEALTKRPDVDKSKVVLVGQSVGGIVMMAAASRSPVPVSAVVSVSGGLFHFENSDGPTPFNVFSGCKGFEDSLIDLIGRYGQYARMPTLWLYAENDPWFQPAFARRMEQAWLQSKGKVDLEFFKPKVIDGHTIFFEKSGREDILPSIEAFMRAKDLSDWNKQTFDKLAAGLDVIQRDDLEAYLRTSLSEKALAVSISGKGRLYWSAAQKTSDRAERNALADCREKENEECVVIARNYTAIAIKPE